MGGGEASPGVAGSGRREEQTKRLDSKIRGPRKHSTTEGEVGDVWDSKVIISADYLL